TVVAGQAHVADEELDPAPTGGISGTVVDEDLLPLEEICVSVSDGGDFVTAITGADGTYHLSELADHAGYEVNASPCFLSGPPNVIDSTITVPVVGGAVSTDQTITMRAGGTIVGSVSASEVGNPP